MNNNKLKHVLLLTLICALILTSTTCLSSCSNSQQNDTKPELQTVKPITFTDWEHIKSLDAYKGTATSETKEDFVAVIFDNMSKGWCTPSDPTCIEFVYMHDGNGHYFLDDIYKKKKLTRPKAIAYMKGYSISDMPISVTKTEWSGDRTYIDYSVKLGENISGLMIYDVVDKDGNVVKNKENLWMIVVNGWGAEYYNEDFDYFRSAINRLKKDEEIVPKFFCESIPLTSENCKFYKKDFEMDFSYGGYGDYFGEMKIKLFNMEHERGLFISTNEAVGISKKTGNEEPTGLIEPNMRVVRNGKSRYIEFYTYADDLREIGVKEVTDYIFTPGGFIPWHEITTP